jgi:ferrous iron transport protein A
VRIIISYEIESRKWRLEMTLYEGEKGSTLLVLRMALPVQTERRLEVLGMLEGTRIVVVNRKKRGAMIVKIRGTRFAMGQSITRHIEVKEV